MHLLLSALFLSLAAGAAEPPATGSIADDAGPAASSTPSMTEFRPSRHGFAFVNSFSGSRLPLPLAALEERLKLPDRFGLCGGMCFAAADFYLSGRPLREEVPAPAPPEQGTALYAYLHQRQSASVGPMAIMATKFLDWMQTPEAGADGTHERTAAEVEAMVQAAHEGKPVVVGLVLVDARESRAVWNNHQVLLYGVRHGDGAAMPTLLIYDPNYPGRDDVVLRWVTGEDPRWERVAPVEGRRPHITRVRGFFQMPYEPAVPPPSLD
jgi:hypothetical protein